MKTRDNTACCKILLQARTVICFKGNEKKISDDYVSENSLFLNYISGFYSYFLFYAADEGKQIFSSIHAKKLGFNGEVTATSTAAGCFALRTCKYMSLCLQIRSSCRLHLSHTVKEYNIAPERAVLKLTCRILITRHHVS